MPKKLLYIEDLYNFYLTNFAQSMRFDATSSGGPIVVQSHGKIRFKKNEIDEKSMTGLMPVTIVSSHIGKNRNGSTISREAMESALPSFRNRPILAYIHTPDGSDQLEFGGHAMHTDTNGEIVYDEVPVGVVPESCNARLEEIDDKTYAVVSGFVYEEYSKASEILQREGECAVSVELAINELSYDADSKSLSLDDFIYSGVTILGKDDGNNEVLPGMEGANITIADFSKLNNSVVPEGGESNMDFEEIKETITEEETETTITESADNIVDEAKDQITETEAKNDDDDDEDAPSDEPNDDVDDDDEDEAEGTDDTDSDDNDDNDDEEDEDKKSNNSLVITDGANTYELSYDERIMALRDLVNATYNSDGGSWYSVSVYDDYLVMNDWYTNQYYKQSYSEEDGKFILMGDRVEVFAQYLTADEVAAIDDMRANYSALVEYKNAAEAVKLHSQREALVTDEKYAAMVETDAYKTLVTEMDNYSLADLETKLKCLFADFAINGGVEVKNKPTGRVSFGRSKTPKAGKYASLFRDKV